MYNEIEGNLITLALSGEFDVIGHGCNCFSTMGAGLAPQMAKAFGCDKFVMETYGTSIDKLGNVDYETLVLGKNTMWNIIEAKNRENEPELTVCNLYTQYSFDARKAPVDYEAITLCMRKMNVIFKGKHIGLPAIGSGLAGGNWDQIKTIIQTELKDCEVTIVIFKK